MPVIALTQEMGSLAKDVAEKLAADYKLDLLRHEVEDHLSSQLRVPKSLINRLREGKAGPIERLRADREGMAIFSAEEVLDVAARGNVVLRGWGATCLLRPVSHVLCVRITRPFEQRAQWLMGHLETDDLEFAQEELRRSDQAHAARMHEIFGVTWGDPLLYDLVLNTGRVSVDSCVQQIRSLAARPEFAQTEASRAKMLALALEARVRSALRADAATREVKVVIEAAADRVRLSGIVLSASERGRVEAVTAQVAGVAAVDNQLRIMAASRLFTSSKN